MPAGSEGFTIPSIPSDIMIPGITIPIFMAQVSRLDGRSAIHTWVLECTMAFPDIIPGTTGIIPFMITGVIRPGIITILTGTDMDTMEDITGMIFIIQITGLYITDQGVLLKPTVLQPPAAFPL
jgi:hypothetical protein